MTTGAGDEWLPALLLAGGALVALAGVLLMVTRPATTGATEDTEARSASGPQRRVRRAFLGLSLPSVALAPSARPRLRLVAWAVLAVGVVAVLVPLVVISQSGGP